MNKLKLKLLVVVGFAFGLIGASVAAPGSPVLTSDNCIISGTLGPAQCSVAQAKVLIKKDIKVNMLRWRDTLVNVSKAEFMAKQVKEIQKAEKTNMRVLKVSKKVTKKPSVKLLGGLVIRDGKCVKAGIYNPKPQPMENCKPAAKTKVACDAGANCIF
ncbi:hypothetical protein [uncultured Gammaproteobacteria bacterium]|nr:hypothetical protein [uncultured Gammaproteobacteria bacterium]